MIKRSKWAQRGQSMGEYAILFAIVIGAAIAMQQYVKSRLQGGVKLGADLYEQQAGFVATNTGLMYGKFDPERNVTSDSTIAMIVAHTEGEVDESVLSAS